MNPVSARLLLWFFGLTALWPGLHLTVFFLRFGKLPPGGAAEALVFAPMGAVSAAIVLVLWSRATTRGRKIGLVLGYVCAAPLAFFGSLGAGLLLPPMWGGLIIGAGLLVVGAFAGMGLGAWLSPRPQTT